MLKRITFHSVVVVLIGTSMALFAGGCATPTTPVQDGDDGDDSSGRPVAVSIFDNNNSEGVRNGPTAATQFTITQSRSIASIETYHWNGGAGTAAPGTVSIRDANGNLVGTWNCTGRPSEGTPANLYWVCTPNIELPAGTYTVEDSDPSTWSCNSASGDAGICSIMASALGDDDTADDDADDPADDANDDADDLADDDSDNDADDDGGDDPDDVDESTPEAVAEQFFERQVAGDTEGMLDLCALHLMSDDDIAESKAALNVIRDRATLSDHSFTHLATGYDAERTSALVRCRHTMTVTADGVSDTQEAGTLFWMILHDGSWKIRNLYPDELVALAVAEKHGVLTARVQNASGMYTWQEVNERFNSELMTATLDTGKLALDTLWFRYRSQTGYRGRAFLVVYGGRYGGQREGNCGRLRERPHEVDLLGGDVRRVGLCSTSGRDRSRGRPRLRRDWGGVGSNPQLAAAEGKLPYNAEAAQERGLLCVPVLPDTAVGGRSP